MGSSQEKTAAATIEVEGIPFPRVIAGTKKLSLVGHGVTDIEIHFLQIKFNAVGVYLDIDSAMEHLQGWKGKSQLMEDEAFFHALVSAPVEKVLRVVVIKEIKGSQYGVQLESSVRDRLVAADKYEDDEEEALDQVSDFFQSKYFRPGSVVTFHFPATLTAGAAPEISFVTDGKEETKVAVENANVAEMIQRWYLGGESAVSQTTVRSLADHFVAILSSP